MHPFCKEVRGGLLKTDCTRNRRAVGFCNLVEYSGPLPPEYQVRKLVRTPKYITIPQKSAQLRITWPWKYMYHVGKLFTTERSVNTPSPKALDVKSSHSSKNFQYYLGKSTDNSKICSFKFHVFIVGKAIHNSITLRKYIICYKHSELQNWSRKIVRVCENFSEL